jgi:hypothetical protein
LLFPQPDRWRRADNVRASIGVWRGMELSRRVVEVEASRVDLRDSGGPTEAHDGITHLPTVQGSIYFYYLSIFNY